MRWHRWDISSIIHDFTLFCLEFFSTAILGSNKTLHQTAPNRTERPMQSGEVVPVQSGAVNPNSNPNPHRPVWCFVGPQFCGKVKTYIII